MKRLSAALAPVRRRKSAGIGWRSDLQLEGETGVRGEFGLQGMSVSAYELIVVPRIWDDPRRREREGSASKQIDGLAARFRTVLDAWTTAVGELGKWLRYEHGARRATSRRRRGEGFPPDRDDGSETTH